MRSHAIDEQKLMFRKRRLGDHATDVAWSRYTGVRDEGVYEETHEIADIRAVAPDQLSIMDLGNQRQRVSSGHSHATDSAQNKRLEISNGGELRSP